MGRSRRQLLAALLCCTSAWTGEDTEQAMYLGTLWRELGEPLTLTWCSNYEGLAKTVEIEILLYPSRVVVHRENVELGRDEIFVSITWAPSRARHYMWRARHHVETFDEPSAWVESTSQSTSDRPPGCEDGGVDHFIYIAVPPPSEGGIE